MVRYTRAHAGIAMEEFIHAIFITCQNNDQVFAVIFHRLQQNLY